MRLMAVELGHLKFAYRSPIFGRDAHGHARNEHGELEIVDVGDDLTRENLLGHATSLKNEKPPLYLDGIKVHNSSIDYRSVHNLQLSRFDGKRWAAIGKMTDLDDPAI
jgi:hypothetical protein